MDDLAHPQAAAGAEDVAADPSAGTAAIEADTTDPQSFYADDQGPEEEPQVEDDDVEGDEDGGPETDIVAPVGLKAEEREQFAQLPPEAQRVMTGILDRRNQDAQKGVDAAISAQRDAERSAADQVAQAQRDFAQRFANVLGAFAPKPPPAELARQNPGEYLYRDSIYKQELAAFNDLAGGISQLNTQAESHFEGRTAEWADEQVKQLKAIPEFANEETRPQFISDINNVGVELGYSMESLAEADASDVFALNRARAWKLKADKWDGYQKKRNERPRAAQGRFAAAASGVRTAQVTQTDTLKALYPND